MNDPEKIIIEAQDYEAEEKEASKKPTVRVLKFMLGQEYYCILITQVKEVIRIPEVTRIPLAPAFVKGAVNLRGAILSVLDIREFFGLGALEKPVEARIIVTDASGYTVGILADAVLGTDNIEEDLIQQPLATLRQELRNYTKGQIQWQDKILILLDLEKVLKSEEIENLRRKK